MNNRQIDFDNAAWFVHERSAMFQDCTKLKRKTGNLYKYLSAYFFIVPGKLRNRYLSELFVCLFIFSNIGQLFFCIKKLTIF